MTERGKRGRPATGIQRQRELHVYLSDEELAEAKRLSERRRLSLADTVRQVLREAAKREGAE